MVAIAYIIQKWSAFVPVVFLLLIFANNLFAKDVAIVSVVVLIILYGKRKGKDSIFSKYNIYSKDCILSKRMILVISLIGVAVLVLAVIGYILEKRRCGGE
jgi:hypothetical protein